MGHHYHHLRRNKPRLMTIILFVLLAVGIGGYWGYHVYTQPFSKKIVDQVGFGIWYPRTTKTGYKLQKNTIQFDQRLNILSFIASNGSQELTFNEQVVPENFARDPGLFSDTVAQIPQITTLESIYGTVSITRPSEDGGVSAIMRARGTMLAVRSSKDMVADEWRSIFNGLDFVQ